MKSRTSPFKWFAVCTVMSWVAWTIARSGIEGGFYELQAPVWVATSHVSDMLQYWTLRAQPKTWLMEAVRDLGRKNVLLEQKLQSCNDAEAALYHLESLCALPQADGFYYEAARVCRRDLSAWWQHMVIRKGRKDGIVEGAGVVGACGVVGKIVEVHESTSVVELITSPYFRTVVRRENDPQPFIFRGGVNATFAAPKGEVTEILSTEAPFKVVSCGMGGVFPDGLSVGEVKCLQIDAGGMFCRGDVELSRALLTLREVAVLLPTHAIQEDS